MQTENKRQRTGFYVGDRCVNMLCWIVGFLKGYHFFFFSSFFFPFFLKIFLEAATEIAGMS